MIKRKCIDFGNDCPHSKIFTLCFVDQMLFHIGKIPTKRMIQIVERFNLARFPHKLRRLTLANRITDCTSEEIVNELTKGCDVK